MDFRPVAFVVGLLVSTLAIVMCIPAAIDYAYGNPDWQVFAASAGVTFFVGTTTALTANSRGARFSIRQAFMMTTTSWLFLTIFAALPFTFSELNLSYTDAFFEAMSGITTTGSTVITGLDSAPPGILIWRALLQWLGGIGIVVMAIAVLPLLQVGGMQLFRMESSDQSEKALPRAAQIASALGIIYLALTVIWAVLYWIFGMSGFDAIAHAMTTVATGGFSTHDTSLGHYNSHAIDYVATLGMLIGGLPFILFLKTLQGNWLSVPRDSQVQWFLGFVAAVIAMTAVWLVYEVGKDPVQALRYASFNIVSVITGTGYATEDYGLWGSFSPVVFFLIMFVGGCAGSTTCGIKVFRFQILYSAARTQVHHLLQPNGVFIPYFNKRPVSEDIIISVLSFFFMWFFVYTLLALGLGFLGLDYITAFSSAATSIANVGPALGPIAGPSGNFQSFPDAAKWLMALGMLLGRLELFTVIVLFSRNFWRP
ncbi:MAG: TrkH family potassium uptake protein [Proteobacteria bacterium]|nr:TrkH family potassium uptake protein [Pseudomonadota bacterium]